VEDAIGQGGGAAYNRDGEPTTVARLVRNLILGGEFIMSHITHFYQLSALDYVQGPGTAPFTPYFDDSFYNPVLRVPDGRDRSPLGADAATGAVPRAAFVNAAGAGCTGLDGIWDNVIVDYLESLRWRRESLAVVAALAGRTPQTQSILAGGVTCRPTVAQCDAVLQVLGGNSTGLISFLKRHQIPLTQIVSYLYGPYGGAVTGTPSTPWTMRRYDNDATNIFSGWGAGARNFLSYGVFNEVDSHGDITNPNRLLKRGYLYGAGGLGSPTVSNVLGNGLSRTHSGAAASGAGSNIVEFIYGSHYRLDTGATVAGTSVESGTEYTASGIVPWNGYTDPAFEVTKDIQSYSWIKSPRILHGGTAESNAIACQVGPLARMAVTGARGVGTGYVPLGPTAGDAALLAALDSECESYKLGEYKSDVMLLHPTLAPILGANLSALIGLFGDVPGVGTGAASAGFMCGASTMDRHRARAYEALKIAKAMVGWATTLKGIATTAAGTYTGGNSNYLGFSMPAGTIRGRGMHEAPRGALSHWITIKDGKIENYQCVVPTTWNCSPRSGDPADFRRRGPVEQAIMGDSAIASTRPSVAGVQSNGVDVPVEILRIVHGFDPCIACAVH
jgi:Ni,Fe-hydrogenase I large subunit